MKNPTKTLLSLVVGDIVIGETDGDTTLLNCGVFSGGFYGDPLPTMSCKPTPQIVVSVNHLTQRTNFFQLYHGNGRSSEFEFKQAQVHCFHCSHGEGLISKGFRLFFRVHIDFVVCVSRDACGRPKVITYSTGHEQVWEPGGKDLFVLRQH